MAKRRVSLLELDKRQRTKKKAEVNKNQREDVEQKIKRE